jgi:hypothetical protein
VGHKEKKTKEQIMMEELKKLHRQYEDVNGPQPDL